MSIDACAIIENRLSSDELGDIADQLNRSQELLHGMREYDAILRSECPTLLPNLHTQAWKLETFRVPEEIDQDQVASGWDSGELTECVGPFGILRAYGQLAAVSWIMCTWRAFLTDSRFRKPLLKATRSISKMLGNDGSGTVVFVPDSSYDESLALDELRGAMPDVLGFLTRQCGPPADRFESIARDDGEAKGYFVMLLGE
jgi:hypothetical protein